MSSSSASLKEASCVRIHNPSPSLLAIVNHPEKAVMGRPRIALLLLRMRRLRALDRLMMKTEKAGREMPSWRSQEQ